MSSVTDGVETFFGIHRNKSEIHFISHVLLVRDVRNEWYRAFRVCPSVLVFQLDNHVTDFDEIWYYASGGRNS